MHWLFAQVGKVSESLTSGFNGLYQPGHDLEEQIINLSYKSVIAASIALIVLVFAAAVMKDRLPQLKVPLFIGIALSVVLPSFILISSTVYLNVKADSGGPVHWHTDFEIWACGNELELRNPFGALSNKIGTATLHEHNDKRIHLEGVVVDKEHDASLAKFMHVIGGAATGELLLVPVENGQWFEDETDGDGPSNANAAAIEQYMSHEGEVEYARFVTGDTCNGEHSEVQAFVYRYDEANKTYTQRKLDNPADYVLRDESNVPPGDCLIIEFDRPKNVTDKLCAQYGVRDVDRCEQFGVAANERSICEIKQVQIQSQPSTEIETQPAEEVTEPTGTDVPEEEL